MRISSYSDSSSAFTCEIDPVYHLLRCAASKSQSTALATTGLTNAKTNLKPKSTNPDTSQTINKCMEAEEIR
ncbi:unnamed protein product [Trichobilharzia regenti]|nr:unnamed protein product [Trichobilharzia regenti]